MNLHIAIINTLIIVSSEEKSLTSDFRERDRPTDRQTNRQTETTITFVMKKVKTKADLGGVKLS